MFFAGGCEQLPDMGGGARTADTTRAPGVPPPGEGLVTTTTKQSVQAAAQQLKSTIASSGATLIADVNHARNAASVGDSLRPSRLLIFGKPGWGTPLMQSVPTTGLDLPQKILVWEGADDSTRLTYNAPAYLKARHDLEGENASLDRVGRALVDLVRQTVGHPPDTTAFNADSISAAAGLTVETSDFNFEETFDRLRKAVQAASGLSVITQVDHAQKGAATADSLRPMQLLIFGNPQQGTPLMQQAPTIGIDLPQKMLVYEGEEGNTFVTYNDPAYLARRHEVADTTGLGGLAKTLEGLAYEATANEEELEELREAKRDTTGLAY